MNQVDENTTLVVGDAHDQPGLIGVLLGQSGHHVFAPPDGCESF